MRKFMLFSLLLLGACQHSAGQYGQSLQAWIGQPQERLIQSWGMPQHIYYLSPEKKLWTYVHFSAPNSVYEPYQNEIYYQAINNENFGVPPPPEQGTNYCKTTFTITGNTITNYGFNGDDCVINGN